MACGSEGESEGEQASARAWWHHHRARGAMSAPRSELLATSKAEVGFLWHGMWRRSGGVALEGLSWLWYRFVMPFACSFGMLRAKVLAGIPAGTDDGGASKRRFPVGGVVTPQVSVHLNTINVP